MDYLGTKGKSEIVHLNDSFCDITGDKISSMSPCVSLFDFIYASEEGLDILSNFVKNSSNGLKLDNIEVKRKSDKQKCHICSEISPIIHIKSSQNVTISKLCEMCLDDKIECGKRIINKANDITIHYDSSGFIVWESNRVECGYVITLGFDNRGRKKSNLRLTQFDKILDSLRNAEKSKSYSEVGEQCDVCGSRENHIIKIPEPSIVPYTSVSLCYGCSEKLRKEIDNFVKDYKELLVSIRI